MQRLIEALMRYELKRSFRRVCWVGDWPPALPADTPVVCYANHHHFYDGHLCWLLVGEHLGRPATLWMADWDRFPFFAAVGVQPFPPDAPERRAATLRRTARRFRQTPQTVLIYFPEGALHAPVEGIRPFPPGAFERLGRLYAGAVWWPLALHVTWQGDKYPTALLTGGAVHDAPDGHERERLTTLWHTLCQPQPSPTHCLLDGRRSPSEVWSFSFAAPFFERYL